MKTVFNVNDGQSTREISDQEIKDYASLYGLDRIINGRYSSLLIVNLIILEQYQGIDPGHVIEEIKHLEGIVPSNKTKPATEFRGEYLKGLWHKHFFPALPSVFGHNITNHFGKHGVHNLVDDIFDPQKSPTVTKEMIEELSHRLVVESLEERGDQEKLTGEWIIYAKEDDNNYYLCISPHNAGDENIANNIKSVCLKEFPFLSKVCILIEMTTEN